MTPKLLFLVGAGDYFMLLAPSVRSPRTQRSAEQGQNGSGGDVMSYRQAFPGSVSPATLRAWATLSQPLIL